MLEARVKELEKELDASPFCFKFRMHLVWFQIH
jgi:hypothetical protein